MSGNRRSIRIFVSSPGDVAEERTRAQVVVEQLSAEFSDALELEYLLWEQEPLLASADFQSQIRTPADFDIFITIIGARLGSPLGDQFMRDDGTPYASGTEFEFEIAMDSFQATGAPDLLVYRKNLGAEAQQRAGAQVASVDAFFTKWFLDARSGTATGAYHWFDTEDHFSELFTLHLRKLLRRFLPRPNNLPAPISNFVGRQLLLEEVRGKLLDGSTRLLTLQGAGGSGKSRVALRAAQDLLPEFRDGVFIIQLAAIRHADLIPNAIATIFDIKQAEHGEMLGAVIEYLSPKELLLVIDNLEQVENAARQINSLLQMCPRLKILATSRSALNVSGGKVSRVAPLGLPPEGRNSLRDARGSDAVRMFVDRARGLRPDFELNQDNAHQLLDICRKLDGLPLAIELASSRMRSMDLDRLTKALRKRFSVLKGGAEDLLDHQRSLREMVLWSYELLTEEEKMLWRRMAIFTGGFTMEAAEIVCDPDDDFIVDVEVESLAEHSLATIHFGEETRVTMLETLREFALEQLEEVGEYEDVRRAFVQWVGDLADASYRPLCAHDEARLRMLDNEHANVLAAIEHAHEAGDVGMTLRIVTGVWQHWFERGHLDEAMKWLEPAEQAGVLDNDALMKARALKGMGSILRFQKELDHARASCETALMLFRDHDDQDGCARALGELGAISISRGELDEAAGLLDQALDIREAASDHSHESFLSATRGVVSHLKGDADDARSHYTRALEIGSEAGDTDSIASALVNMGELSQEADDAQTAQKYYGDSLALFYQRGKRVAIAYCVELIAALRARTEARYGHAAMLFGFANKLREEIHSPIEPFNEARLAQDIAFVKDALDPQSFDTSWQAGADLYLEEFLDHLNQASA